MNAEQTKKFYNMMQEQLIFYNKFFKFETQKFEDVKNNKLELIDEHVKKEEVFLLKARGIETKREKFLKNLGLENKSMKEVIETAPEEFKKQLSDIFEQLSDILLDLKETNSRCNSMIQLRLHKIENTLKQLDEKNEKNKNEDSIKNDNKNTKSISYKV